MGNVVNRVFDSSGPEGKVRGTPQQIIDKYMILARDAQLSNDRVAAENFLQHAEHYTRMLGEAQRELQREADSRRDYQDNNHQNGQQRDNRDRPRREAEEAEASPAFYTPEPPRQAPASATDVIDFTSDDEGETSVLVDTPESRPEPQESIAPAPAPAPEPEAPAEAAPARRDASRRSASERRPAAPAAETEGEDAAPVEAVDGAAPT